jgi:hypothetical protein
VQRPRYAERTSMPPIVSFPQDICFRSSSHITRTYQILKKYISITKKLNLEPSLASSKPNDAIPHLDIGNREPPWCPETSSQYAGPLCTSHSHVPPIDARSKNVYPTALLQVRICCQDVFVFICRCGFGLLRNRGKSGAAQGLDNPTISVQIP